MQGLQYLRTFCRRDCIYPQDNNVNYPRAVAVWTTSATVSCEASICNDIWQVPRTVFGGDSRNYPVFSHDQFCVAVSWTMNWSRVHVLLGEGEITNKTSNIIYKEMKFQWDMLGKFNHLKHWNSVFHPLRNHWEIQLQIHWNLVNTLFSGFFQ